MQGVNCPACLRWRLTRTGLDFLPEVLGRAMRANLRLTLFRRSPLDHSLGNLAGMATMHAEFVRH